MLTVFIRVITLMQFENNIELTNILISQTSIKRQLKGNVKSGLFKMWSLKKGLGSE